MQVTYKTNKHGTITLANGETVELNQEAYLCGTKENPVYRASAYLGSENPEDETGSTVTVTWEVINMDAEDESDCCDWDSPISINHYSRGELI